MASALDIGAAMGTGMGTLSSNLATLGGFVQRERQIDEQARHNAALEQSASEMMKLRMLQENREAATAKEQQELIRQQSAALKYKNEQDRYLDQPVDFGYILNSYGVPKAGQDIIIQKAKMQGILEEGDNGQLLSRRRDVREFVTGMMKDPTQVLEMNTTFLMDAVQKRDALLQAKMAASEGEGKWKPEDDERLKQAEQRAQAFLTSQKALQAKIKMDENKDRYKEAGGLLFDTKTQQWIMPPADYQKPMTPYQQEQVRLREEDQKIREQQHKERMAELQYMHRTGQVNNAFITKTLTELPKQKSEAMSAATSMNQIDKAMGLINTKDVTGKSGQFKAFMAPYAEAFGMPSENLDAAQAFQLMARAIIGPMRLDIVGPGQVSDYEQDLMKQLAGGGGAAKGAAKELLGYWKKLAENKVKMYNETVQGVSGLVPETTKIYRRINPKDFANIPPVAPGGLPGVDVNAIDAELARRGVK